MRRRNVDNRGHNARFAGWPHVRQPKLLVLSRSSEIWWLLLHEVPLGATKWQTKQSEVAWPELQPCGTVWAFYATASSSDSTALLAGLLPTTWPWRSTDDARENAKATSVQG